MARVLRKIGLQATPPANSSDSVKVTDTIVLRLTMSQMVGKEIHSRSK
jgi:hypothetical protein